MRSWFWHLKETENLGFPSLYILIGSCKKVSAYFMSHHVELSRFLTVTVSLRKQCSAVDLRRCLTVPFLYFQDFRAALAAGLSFFFFFFACIKQYHHDIFILHAGRYAYRADTVFSEKENTNGSGEHISTTVYHSLDPISRLLGKAACVDVLYAKHSPSLRK